MIPAHRTDFSKANDRTGKGIDSPLDNEGHTALHLSILKDDASSVVKLLQMRANPHHPDKAGQPPLYAAIAKRNIEIIKILLENGATFRVEDTAKRTPIMWAIEQKCDIEFIDQLRQLGASLAAQNKNGQHAMHTAAVHNRPRIIEYLFRHGAPIDLGDNDQKTPLHAATETKAYDALKALLAMGADPLTRTKEIKTPLFLAAAAGDEKAVGLLLEQPSVKQTVNEYRAHNNGFSPLMAAVAANHVSIAEKLIDIGALLNQRDHQNRHSLYIAIEGGHTQMADLLIRHGADVEKAEKPAGNGAPMLHKINTKAYGELLRLLYQAGANLNATDTHGETALYKAVDQQAKEKVKMLLELGADPNLSNKQGRRPIDEAMSMASYVNVHEIVHQLLEHRADANLSPTPETTESPLHIAVRDGKPELVKLLLTHNASVNERDREDGLTPWLMAAKYNQPEIADLLVEKGADLSKRDNAGKSALHLAAEGGAEKILKTLLEKSEFAKQVNDPDFSGATPLHYACTNNSAVEGIKLLINAGADLVKYNEDGLTPLHSAVASGSMEVFSLFEKTLGKKANWNLATQGDNETLLHIAARMNSPELAQQLIKLGADPKLKNGNEETALDLAIEMEHEEVSALLVRVMKPRKKPAPKPQQP